MLYKLLIILKICVCGCGGGWVFCLVAYFSNVACTMLLKFDRWVRVTWSEHGPNKITLIFAKWSEALKVRPQGQRL